MTTLPPSTPRPRRATATGLVLVALLAAAGVADAAARVGNRAPGFTLPDLAGRPVTLANLRGRVVVLDFWASWCAPCGSTLPVLDALARRFPASTLTVLAVSVDRSRAAAESLLAERVPDPRLTVLHDAGSDVLARYGAPGLPTTYVIDAEGTVRLVESGASTDGIGEVLRTIEGLLRDPDRRPERDDRDPDAPLTL